MASDGNLAYLLTTSFGMCDVVAAEVFEAFAGRRRGEGEEGWDAAELAELGIKVDEAPEELVNTVMVTVRCPLQQWKTGDVVQHLLKLRSVHDVLLFHGCFHLPDTPNPPLSIYDYLRAPDCAVPVPSLTLPCVRNFRVSCNRAGKHAFNSSDVEMEAGGALHERYGLPAKMKDFDVCVRVDVHVKKVVVGSLVNDAGPVSKRHKLSFVRTVTLKPNVAYAMLRLAGVCDGDVVLDPFVGSGTILLEALELFPNVRCCGVDRSAAAVKGTLQNAEAAPFPCTQRLTCVQGNARTLHKHFDFKFDRIVSNFPWGLKTAATADVKELYKGALASCWGALKDHGVLCCIVLHDLVTVHLLRTSGNWDILHARIVKTGGKLPAIIVARKRPQPDPILPALRHQRASMYRYIQDNPKKEDVEQGSADGKTGGDE